MDHLSKLQDLSAFNLKLHSMFADAFYENPKVKIDSDCCVVTASDDCMFLGLQIMLSSIYFSHDVEVIFYDLGLSPENRKWVESTGVTIIDPSPKHIIYNAEISLWQTWNKPFYIANSPKRYTLWIDADACVLRSLKPAFEIIKQESLLSIADNVAQVYTDDPVETLKSYPWLYDVLPSIPEEQKMKSGMPNAGVFGIDLESDIGKAIMEQWIYVAYRCLNDEKTRSGSKWYDQNAYLWALEKLNLTHLVKKEKYWNDGCTWNDYGRNFVSNIKDLFEIIPTIESGIIHFAGTFKPWRDHV